ncbi:MAG TPA: PAS domain-containing protein, partial [Burkholderiaceae bacterium]|nr:PAS domain-containing protein [Burkholderiaceae bacterium]
TRVVGVMVDDTEAHRLSSEAAAAGAQLELAASLAGIGLWRYDFASGRLHHDERLQAILQRPVGPEGVPLDEVRTWIHPDDLADVQAAFARAVDTDEPVDLHTRYRHADGRWRTVLTRRVVRRDASGRPIAMLGLGLDVTEQHQRTQDTLHLARWLEAAAESARVGLWSGPLDGQPPEWNARMFEILGRDPALGPLRLGDSLRDHVHPDDRDRVAAQTLAWMRGPVGTPLSLVLRIVRRDGQTRWIEVRSRLELDGHGARRTYGVMFDVTESRSAIEALRAANERLSLALSSAGMGTWVHDLDPSRDEWDAQMYLLRGLDPSGPVPTPSERMAMVLPEDWPRLEAMATPLHHSAQPLAYEFRIRRADGAIRTLASRSIALTDETGRVTRRIGVNWDVTEARATEAAQREREMALNEARTKSALLSRVSHELRTPLNAILGFAQLMLAEDGKAPDDQRRRRLHQIREAGESLLTLVDSVLELNALSDGPVPVARAPVDLGALAGRALAAVQPDAAARGVRLHADVGPLAALGDERRAMQVLALLIAHAVHRSANGATVRIAGHVDGEHAVVAVSDEGAPIAREAVAELFDAFGSGAAPLRSSLGMALARAQAEQLGGRTELLRSDARGTVVAFRLPRAEPATAAPAGTGQEPSVLYVEDNEVNMLIVRELLAQRPQLRFHGAANGTDGLAMARRLRPSLVLVDMQLPDMNGTELLGRLRADPHTARLTCVALSANAMPEDVQAARAAGFDDYWTKPIDLSALLAAVDRLVPTLKA